MRGEKVAQTVAGNRFSDAGFFKNIRKNFLEGSFGKFSSAVAFKNKIISVFIFLDIFVKHLPFFPKE